MHGSSLERMAWFVKNWLKPGPGRLRVLDVGSCDVAGGSYRQFFDPEHYEYVGLDMAPGPNVDIAPAHPYAWTEVASDSFDVAISGQAFEHMEFFWLAALEMARVLKPAGLMCIVAPRGFDRHRYPVDCYRFDADGMVAIARWANLVPLHASTDMRPPNAGQSWHIENCEDSLLVARKPLDWPGPIHAGDYICQPLAENALAGHFQPCEKIVPPKPDVVPREDYDRLQKTRELEIAELQRQIDHWRGQARALEKSNSWRLTAPLRALRKALRREGKAIM